MNLLYGLRFMRIMIMNKIRISKVVKNFYTNESVVWIEIYEDNDNE